jgi:peptidoglycan/xylan/chitin deacetylase (PgdA/CDA1 family)
MLLVLPAYSSVSLSVGSNYGGYSEKLDAGVKEAVQGFTTINKWGLQHSLSLTGQNTGTVGLKESHAAGNLAGSYAEVGVNITKAKSIRYTYYLYPGQSNGYAVTKDPVAAGEMLDVTGAQSATAYAKAFSGAGYDVGVSTTVTNGDLVGYQNFAQALKTGACAFQGFQTATGNIQMDLTTRTLPAATKMTKVTLDGLELNSQPDTSISTKATGTVTNYYDGAAMRKDNAQLEHRAHIEGTFDSASNAKGATSLPSKVDTASPNDLIMKAGIVSGTPTVSGTLNAVIIPPVIPPVNTNAKKILIRGDDVWWSSPGYDWVSDIVSKSTSKKLAATYAVVPIGIELVQGDEWSSIYFNWLKAFNPENIELATHGYAHEDIQGLTYTVQLGLVQQGTKIMTDTVGYRPYTWVCPYDTADENTVIALAQEGYHSISGDLVDGADSGIAQFAPGFYWETWKDDGNLDSHSTLSQFTPVFDQFLASTDDYLLLEMHPNTYFTEDPVTWEVSQTDEQKSAAKDFEDAINYIINTGGDKVEFMTIEQAYQANKNAAT